MALFEEDVEADDEDFSSVRIGEFYSPRVVAFDLYLRLGTNRYLRVFRAGEAFNEAELRAYENERGVRQVYFSRRHRNAYAKSSYQLLQKIAPLAGVPIKAKFGVARILGELYMQQLFEASDDERPRLVEQGKPICAAIAAWVEAEPGLEAFLLQADRFDPHVEGLAFLTGLFACAFSRRFPWKSQRTSETLLYACFLADVGLAAMPEVARIRPKRMSGAQRKEYEQHPELSYLLLKEIGGVPEAVLNIVRQHHEYCDGSGFPARLSGNEILQLAKVVSLCGDVMRTASDYLLPAAEAARVLFPELSKAAFTMHPELLAKYDRAMLEVFFKIFEDKGKKKEDAA